MFIEFLYCSRSKILFNFVQHSFYQIEFFNELWFVTLYKVPALISKIFRDKFSPSFSVIILDLSPKPEIFISSEYTDQSLSSGVNLHQIFQIKDTLETFQKHPKGEQAR